MAGSRPLFTRPTSGVIRSATLFDAFIFGVTLAIPFAANFFLFPYYTYFLPGANWTLAVIIGLVLSIPNYFVYAGLGSMMPRSGGDYVFQSRGVHAVVAMISVIAWTLFILIPVYAVLMLYSSITLGISPFLTAVGVITGNSGLVSAGTWVAGSTGLFILTVILMFVAFFNNVVGMKWISRTQRYIFLPAMLISGITIPVLLFSTSTSAFRTGFNNYVQVLNGTTNAYSTILNATAKAGFVVPSFNLVNTVLVGVIIAITFLMWAVWSAPVFGEIKGANSLRGLLVAFVAGGLFQALFLMIPELAGFQSALGTTFVNAVAFQSYVGVPSLSFYPSMGLLTIMATNNVGVAILVCVGYITAGYFITQLFFANLSRYLLAGSIDGVLPQWLSSPSRTFKTPVNALILVFAAFLLYAFAIDLNPANLAFWLSVAVWTSACLFFGTNLAAVAIPRTNPSIYKSSPIAKYRGVLVTAGVISFVLSGFVIVGYLVIPQLSIGLGPLGGLVIGISAVLGVIWYVVWGSYQRRRGIEIGMAYREVPPE